MSLPTLLRLPPEIQNRIYRLILVKDDPINVQRQFDRQEEQTPLSLLHTCKEINKNARPIYYGCNTFKFSAASPELLYRMEKFMRGLDLEGITLCQSIRLEFAASSPRFDIVFNHTCACAVYFDIDFKTKEVWSNSCSDCCGSALGWFWELAELEVREILMWFHMKPRWSCKAPRLALNFANFISNEPLKEWEEEMRDRRMEVRKWHLTSASEAFGRP